MKSRKNRRWRAIAAVLAALCLAPTGTALASRGEDAMAARWEAMGRYYAALENEPPGATEPTIVRDTEDVLARVLAGVALLVPLAAGGGWALVRHRTTGRTRAGV